MGDYSDEELTRASSEAERIQVCEKRITAGWMLYSLLEIKQRYHIKGPVSCNIDHALADYHLQIRDGFYRVWSKHSCNKSGCGSVLVVDGGLKAQRKICGAVKSGVKVFENSNTTLVTGCTKHPGDNKYCKEHRKEETPAVSSSKLGQDNKSRLRSSKQKQQVYMDQDFTDSVYITKELLDF